MQNYNSYGNAQANSNLKNLTFLDLGSRNQSRFQNTQGSGFSAAQGKQQSGSNSFSHQQRKFSYSPVLKQSV